MMHKEKWFCKVRQCQLERMGNKLFIYADAPFGDHVGPPVQFGGALIGHAPPRSLEAV